MEVRQHEWQVRMNDLCDELAVAVIDQGLADRQRANPDPEIARAAANALDDAQAREDQARDQLREHALVGLEAGYLTARTVTEVSPPTSAAQRG